MGKNIVTSKGIQVWIECKNEVKWCELNWRDLRKVILFLREVKWSELRVKICG
jgi:hypothetical protein